MSHTRHTLSDLNAVRAQLAARLAEMTGRGARVAEGLADPVSSNLEDAATEAEDDAGLMHQDALIRREMSEVSAAISRIDTGDYGQCVHCGHEIALARLSAQPEAALCISCAAVAERH